jgi:hypothetical protein
LPVTFSAVNAFSRFISLLTQRLNAITAIYTLFVFNYKMTILNTSVLANNAGNLSLSGSGISSKHRHSQNASGFKILSSISQNFLNLLVLHYAKY